MAQFSEAGGDRIAPKLLQARLVKHRNGWDIEQQRGWSGGWVHACEQSRQV